MATAEVTISGTVASALTGALDVGPINIVSTNASVQRQQLVLANGDNTITLPTTVTPTGVIIHFAAASTTNKTLKGVGGDTGIRLSKTGPTLLTFDSASLPASIIVNSSAADTGNVTEILFF